MLTEVNACYHSIQNVSFSHIVFKTLYHISCFIWLKDLVFSIKVITWIEVVSKHTFRTKKEEFSKIFMMRDVMNLSLHLLHQMLLIGRIKDYDMFGACSTHKREAYNILIRKPDR